MRARVARWSIAVGVGVEVLGLLAWSAAAGWSVLAGQSGAPVLALVAVVVGLAVVLALAARAVLASGSGPGRALVVTWQLVQAGTAGSVIGADVAITQVDAVAWTAVGLAVLVVVASLADARGSADEVSGPAGPP